MNDQPIESTAPPEFWQGVEQFNQRQFYDCHDTLEALWMDATEPDKRFYQGILQIAVAMHHLGNQNLRGAMILLGEGSNRLRSYQPAYMGIDVTQLLDQAIDLLKQLQRMPPDPGADERQGVNASDRPSYDQIRSFVPCIVKISP